MTAYDFDDFHVAHELMLDIALDEIGAHCKRSHWMWFVFPQVRGLSTSPEGRKYAIDDLAMARAYWNDTSLRLAYLEALTAITDAHLDEGMHPVDILGWTDFDKFKSSITLFFFAVPHVAEIREAMERHGLCSQTISLLHLYTPEDLRLECGRRDGE